CFGFVGKIPIGMFPKSPARSPTTVCAPVGEAVLNPGVAPAARGSSDIGTHPPRRSSLPRQPVFVTIITGSQGGVKPCDLHSPTGLPVGKRARAVDVVATRKTPARRDVDPFLLGQSADCQG